MRVNKRTVTVLLIIAVILLGAWGGTALGRARKTAKYLADLAGEKPDKIMDAMNELRLRGKAAGPALVGVLGSGQVNDKSRAAWLLGIIRYRPATDPLIAALPAKELELRIAAAQALGQLGARANETDKAKIAPALQGLLEDEKADVKVRQQAAVALAMVGGETAVAPLAKVLADHPPKPPPPPPPPPPGAPPAPAPPPDTTLELRRTCASALGHSGRPAAAKALEAVLKDEADPATEVRVAAAYALADVAAAAREPADAEEALTALLTGLKDKCGDVRVAAVYALRRANVPASMDSEVTSALEKAKDDSHFWARRAAGEAMRTLQLGR